MLCSVSWILGLTLKLVFERKWILCTALHSRYAWFINITGLKRFVVKIWTISRPYVRTPNKSLMHTWDRTRDSSIRAHIPHVHLHVRTHVCNVSYPINCVLQAYFIRFFLFWLSIFIARHKFVHICGHYDAIADMQCNQPASKQPAMPTLPRETVSSFH